MPRNWTSSLHKALLQVLQILSLLLPLHVRMQVRMQVRYACACK